jgi:hypothetical protein
MAATWVLEEMQDLNMNDARTNARLCEVLTQLGRRPTASIPAACGGHAEMTAAYRLFDNPKVTFRRILQPHAQATRKRIATQPTVLLAQDTTEIDLTRPTQQVRGAGPLDAGLRRGLFLHELHAFTPDGTPLGTLRAAPWVRPTQPREPPSRAQRRALPIEHKESYRWVQTLREAQAQALRCPQTRMVCLADSEADLYELLVEAQREPRSVEWIVRGCHDRKVKVSDSGTAQPSLYRQLAQQPARYRQTLSVQGRRQKVSCDIRQRRQPQTTRQATVEIRCARVTLHPPSRPDRTLPPLEVNVVLAQEVGAPATDVPIEWLLLTNLPVDYDNQIREVVEFYRVRWMIEIFFRVLKSGCRIEGRKFEDLARVLRSLAVYLIVAWRTLYVCRLSRFRPGLSCEAIFAPMEWKPVWQIVYGTPAPAQPPALEEITRMIAQLGGYIPRKNSPPGPQTLWIGLQRTYDFALCWNIFGPGAQTHQEHV